MSEEIKNPKIDVGLVAKVIWQAHKTFQEQLGVQGIPDWNNAKNEDLNEAVEVVSDYLSNKEKFKEGHAPGDKKFALTCAIIDALIPTEDGPEQSKSAPKKKAAEKKN